MTEENQLLFITAAKDGKVYKVSKFLEKGDVDVNGQDGEGNTALIHASRSNHTDIVQLLVDKGASVDTQNEEGDTALMVATINGRTDVVKLLLDRGAEIDVQNKKGYTALFGASSDGRKELVQLLLERGANLKLQSNYGRRTALVAACQYGKMDIVKLLLDKGAYTKINISYGSRIKKSAKKNGHLNIVELLDKHEEMIRQKSLSSNQSLNENNSNAEMVQLKREIGILKGRQLITDAIKNLNAVPIHDLPIEYVQDCTSNFQIKLGEGGAGEVFLATDKVYPNIQYVAKRIHETNIQQMKADAFRRELEALRRLRHPNIVRLYATTKLPNYNILILEYVSSGTLRSHIASVEKRQLLSSWTRLNILCELATALHFLHHGDETKQKYSILHRDIKSDNICLDSNFTVKLIDCGLAKFTVVDGEYNRMDHSIAASLINSTISMMIQGTPGYICPAYAEKIIPEYTSECDVYSFGVVMLEMIIGCLQNVKGDLTRMYNTPLKLVKSADKSAGIGWDHYLTPLAELALQCVNAYQVDERPNFKDITRDLSQIRMRMTGCAAADPDYDDDDGEEKKEEDNNMDCNLCYNKRAQNHGIICTQGHFMCSTCCIHTIVSYCSISRTPRDSHLSCRICPMPIHLDDLIHKVPIEYIMLLQNVQRYNDDMKSIDQQIADVANRQQSMETQIIKVEGSVDSLELEMKKVHDQVLSAWKYLAMTIIDDYPCPQYIIIKPMDNDRKKIRSWFRKKVTIFFVCEHSWELIEAFEKIEPLDWIIRVAPWASMTIQMLIKSATFGLDISDIADHLVGLVEKKFPEFNLLWTKAFRNAHNLSTAEVSGQLCQDESIKKVMKDAYKVLVDEADKPKHQGWKSKLCSVMTPDGMKWVKKEFVGEYNRL